MSLVDLTMGNSKHSAGLGWMFIVQLCLMEARHRVDLGEGKDTNRQVKRPLPLDSSRVTLL